MLNYVKYNAIMLNIFCRYKKTSYLCLRELKCWGEHSKTAYPRDISPLDI